MNFKNVSLLSTTLLLLMAMGVSFTSCSSDDDPKPEARITEFSITNAGQSQDLVIQGVIAGNNVTVAVPYETDLTSLTFEAVLTNGASITPTSGTALDFTEARNMVVINGDLSETYSVSVTKADPDAAVLKAIEVASAFTNEAYQTDLNLMNQTITVTFNNLQADTVVITSMEFGPNGAVASTEAGKGVDLSLPDQKITISFAGEDKVYTFVPNITTAGFDATKAETIMDKTSLAGLVPTEMNDNNSRGADYNGKYVFVTSRTNGNHVYYYDIEAAVFEAKELDMTGVDGGSWAISDVQCVGDAIYACNMVMAAADKVFKVYKWDNVNAAPSVVLSYTTTNDKQRLGDALSIIGDPTGDGYIMASNFPGYGGLADGSEVYMWKATGGTFGDAVVSNPTLEEANKLGQYGRVNALPGVPNKFLVSGAEAMYIINTDGTVDYEISGDVIQGRAMDANVFEYNGGRYLSYTVNREWQAEGAFLEVVNITEGADAVAGIKALTPESIASKVVYKKMLSGPIDPWVNANNTVVMNADNNPEVFAFTVLSGFIIEELNR
ncbi:protein of unknown function [Saccharicrinis carchari]|uniref:DUF4623 domain-containing protein n=1 Tax=Saccharicrinis carchari TaxID=1168039 RepID=A0A521F6D6_SACCC|nr:DUF4623 domain-containing protein [Saccharicrinis carchari]SMO91739.1 protein of unknown function [Saccharicrinis carchari]